MQWLFLASTTSSRLASKKRKETPIFLDRNPFRAHERTFYRARMGRTRRALRYHCDADADLLCGPVKHLYRPIRGELTGCPIAVRVANRKLADPRTALYTNVNAKWQVCWVQRFTRTHPSPSSNLSHAKVPHLNKPYDTLFPSINRTTCWLIITWHFDAPRPRQNSREMRNLPCLSLRITLNYPVRELTDRDFSKSN